MSDEENLCPWTELEQGGDLGLELTEDETGGFLVFEAVDTVFDLYVEEEEDGTKRIRIPLTEDELLGLMQSIREARSS